MAKRKYVTQLPVVHQTSTLQKFFSATVDQVFQPGETLSINAYVGQKPSYFDALKDFYKVEPSASRSFYQLEPSMTARADDPTTYSDLLFYQDLVNNMRFQGANTDNESRLFESDSYSWAPPISIHKLNTYRDYYWLPDGPPVLVLTVPTAQYTGDGATTVFAIPDTLGNASINPTVQVNGLSVSSSYANNQVTLSTAPGIGARVVVWANTNLAQDIIGQSTYTFGIPATAYVSQTQNGTLITFPSEVIETPPSLELGMRVRIIDNTGDHTLEIGRDSQKMITLNPVDAMIYREQPLQTVLERNSATNSPWSRMNHWYHKSLMIYTNDNYNPVRATRPIIEFQGDSELFQYPIGARRLPDITDNNHLTVTIDPLSFNGWNIYTQGAPTGFHDTAGNPIPLGRHIVQSSVVNPSLAQQILQVQLVDSSGVSAAVQAWGNDDIDYDASGDYVGVGDPSAVWSNYDNLGWEGDYSLQVTVPDVSTLNDIVLDASTIDSGTFVEYVYTGTQWSSSGLQQFTPPYAPLFNNYSSAGVLLGSTKIFGFTLDTTVGAKVDTVLGYPVSRNTQGNIEFTDFQSSGSGFTWYKVGTQFGNNWHHAGASAQVKNSQGFYAIPNNLQANPLNQNIDQISVNEWTAHFNSMLAGQPFSYLEPLSAFDYSQGTKILQSRSSLLRVMLMNSSASTDFLKVIQYSEREYQRYRGKFAQTLNTMANSQVIDDTQGVLTRILTQLKSAKTPDFPFANTNMGGAEWYIPTTGAFLGMTPLWPPQGIIDTSPSGVQILFIRGHDGSLTPGVTRGTTAAPITSWDPQDLVTLALEQAIYNSAPSGLKTARRTTFDILGSTPGKYRASDYSATDYLGVALPLFERYVGSMGLDYRTNSIYNASNPFTFNYSTSKDNQGKAVPGYWRGMYRWFLDTDRPHVAPWEMLGWTSEPAWWGGMYNWTNSAKRAALLHALENGIVDNVGTVDLAFARPGVSAIIPVDTQGNLLDPLAAKMVVDTGLIDYSLDWTFGDRGPIENSWWNSFQASFTWASLGYLLKPARFTESNWQTLGEELVFGSQADGGQWLRVSSNDRELDRTSLVHNEKTPGGAKTRALGIQTWLSDYLVNQGQDVSVALGDRVRTVDANLSHKLGAFLDPASLRTYTENSGLIPQEDVSVIMYRSPSVREEFYGGVIVERSKNGWSVIGYDVLNPSFSILPVEYAGRRSIVTIDPQGTNNAVDWHPNTYYSVGVLVYLDGTNYRCIKTHTSSAVFEQTFWQAESLGRQLPTNSVTWYQDHEDFIETVPYGQEFLTRQEVTDFLSGYQAYLETRGWVFDSYDSATNAIQDFKYSTQEFLFWSQTNWAVGTFIALSPVSQGVKFSTDYGTVQNVETLVNGVFSVVDRGGKAIAPSTITTNRLDDEITVGVTQGGIFGLRVFVSEVEQALIWENTTIFNDVIYSPQFDLRQPRIRMIANLSTGWVGRLDAPGFVITDNRLVPSFDRQVEDLRYSFDIEKAINLPLRANARHQIGYQERSYLDDLMPNEINQFEFYQGMIQQKGAPGVFSKLLRNTELTASQNLNFLEEWAFRTGVYGGVDNLTSFEFLLAQDDQKANPQLIINDPQATTDSQEDTTITLFNPTLDQRFIVPVSTPSMFPSDGKYTRGKGWLTTPGYVRVDETDWQGLTFESLNTTVLSSLTEPQIGDALWVYDTGISWDVFKAQGVSTLSQISMIENKGGVLRVTMDGIVSTVAGDWIYVNKAINATNTGLSGFYKVLDASLFTSSAPITSHQFLIAASTNADHTFDPLASPPSVCVMKSLRARYDDNTTSASSLLGLSSITGAQANTLLGYTGAWVSGDFLYIDVCYEPWAQAGLLDTMKRWAVFKFDGANFVAYRTQPARVDRAAIRDIKIFDTTAVRTSRSLNAKPLINSNIIVWDPIQGLLVGVADEEVAFKLDYDPASYNSGAASTGGETWGAAEVGKLWWDMSTTRYLTAETNATLDAQEMKYRATAWGQLAPGASVDIYEWTASSLTPSDYQAAIDAKTDPQYSGTVLNADDASYVTGQVWNSNLAQYVPIYYFWVKNPTTTPNVEFRSLNANDVSLLLSNPTGQGISWVAPLSVNSMLASNVGTYLNATTSIQFTVKQTMTDVPRHVEWQLMRRGDERSLPDATLWNKVMASLTGKDLFSNPIPSPTRFHTDKIGYDVEHGQSLFQSPAAARKHAVKYLNNLFAQTRIRDERYSPDILTTEEMSSRQIQWAQASESYYQKPLPVAGLWTDRARVISNPDALVNNTLVADLVEGESFWSVLGTEYDLVGNTYSTTSTSNGVLLNYWHYAVPTLDAITGVDAVAYTALVAKLPAVGVNPKMRILVQDTLDTGFWSLWEATRVDNTHATFSLIQVQRYDTTSSWSYVDWYSTGYTLNDEPADVYATAQARDTALGTSPTVTLVKLLDDGTGRWVWTSYDVTNGWTIVAKEAATIALSDALWSNTGGPTLDLQGIAPSTLDATTFQNMVSSRDLGYEFNYLLNTLRDNILHDIEINDFFFSMVKYVHTEQDYVDWCFKTSFMFVTGYSDRLRQDPVAYLDLTQNLLQYIEEVKPYHVKVRDFISKYQPDQETANVRVTDFDYPAYLDSTTGTVRILDPNVEADAVILSSGKWVAWWDQYQQVKNGTITPEKSLYRKIIVTRGGKPTGLMGYDSGSSTVLSQSITPDEAINVTLTETLYMNIYRDDRGEAQTNDYDVGYPLAPYPTNSDGTINFASLTYEVNAENWDVEAFDDDVNPSGDTFHYVQRSLIADPNGTFTGTPVASPYGLVDFWGESLPTINWNSVTDTYSPGVDIGSWYAYDIPDGYGFGLQLVNPRVLSIRMVDNVFTADRMSLHVFASSTVGYYGMNNPAYRIVYQSTVANQLAGTTNRWTSVSTAAPLGQPL